MSRAKAIRAVKDWIIRWFPRLVNAYGQWRHVDLSDALLLQAGFKKEYSLRYGVNFVKYLEPAVNLDGAAGDIAAARQDLDAVNGTVAVPDASDSAGRPNR
jgi:hypothetical protein